MEKKALSVALMVALLATSFLELQARVDLFTALTFGGEGWKEPCCNKCGTVCTKSLPPICPCTYVRPYCPSECKGNCICNRRMPPTCTCTVMKWNCTVCPIPRIE